MAGEGLDIRIYLDEIVTRLTDAAAIAKAAVACAEAGSTREALRIALDLDEILSEVTTLHSALILVGRLQRNAKGVA
ncbi:hypothetical protein ACXIUS_23555 [Bosea thiooxidans]